MTLALSTFRTCSRLPPTSRSLPHLLRSHFSTSTPTPHPLRFSLGISYASKSSPPLCSPAEADAAAHSGFHPPSKIGNWKRGMLGLGGGRTELFDTKQETREEDLMGRKEEVEERRRWGAGEDSFFVEQSGNSKTYLALSDGVGGWSQSGHDPSLFSESLTYHSHLSVLRNPSMKPKAVIEKGYEGVSADEGVPCGSSTMCVVSLMGGSGGGAGGEGRLEGANLGDSGFLIIRDGKVVLASASQTHYFNCPRQLAKLESADRSNNITDLPKHADTYSHTLKPGDMVLLYTDGLSDNVHPTQILSLLSHVDKTLSSPQNSFLLPEERAVERARLFADVLVGFGRLVMGRGEGVVTPFEEEAAKHGLRYKGGKIDDITVLTANVTEDVTPL